jgi:hypothetical protein
MVPLSGVPHSNSVFENLTANRPQPVPDAAQAGSVKSLASKYFRQTTELVTMAGKLWHPIRL